MTSGGKWGSIYSEQVCFVGLDCAFVDRIISTVVSVLIVGGREAVNVAVVGDSFTFSATICNTGEPEVGRWGGREKGKVGEKPKSMKAEKLIRKRRRRGISIVTNSCLFVEEWSWKSTGEP